MTDREILLAMYGDVKEIKEDVTVLKEDVRVLKEDVREIKQRLDIVEKDVVDLKKETHDIRVYMENKLEHEIKIIAENHLELYKKLSVYPGSGEHKEEHIMINLRLKKLEKAAGFQVIK